MDETTSKRPISPPELASGKKKKVRYESQKLYDQKRGKTRINIGVAFTRWRQLRNNKGLKSDAELATFLLDRFEKGPQTSTPMKRGVWHADTISSIASSDTDEQGDKATSELAKADTTKPHGLAELEWSLTEMSIDDEQHVDEGAINDLRNSIIDWAGDAPLERPIQTEEMDIGDEEDMPSLSIKFGGALNQVPSLDKLPVIGLDETVHDLIPELDPVPETCTYSDSACDLRLPQVKTAEHIVGAKASIIYEECLRHLASFVTLPVQKCAKLKETGEVCQQCPPYRVHIKERGTASVLEWICADGHLVWQWVSQPVMKFGMQAGDFMLSTNILLSGNNYNKVALLFKFMNMGMVGRGTFFSIQDTYCVDTVKSYWMQKRAEAIAKLQRKDVVVLADGRNDTPGHCAQYCSYTAMENDTREIISVVTVDKRQTDRRSTVMEKEAFIRTVDQLMAEVKLVEICTDAHSQISAVMDPEKGRYKGHGINHSLDMWHGAKNLAKKIAAAAKIKEQSALLLWLKDIVNHFWWCCKKAENFEEFLILWVGIIHHVCNEHEWATGQCQHGLIEEAQKEWIENDSKAHEALVDIVLKKRWLKDIHKYLRFRSTADLESFHNHVLMYASKRFAFTPPVYEARVILAALDYNFHLGRPTRQRADGSNMYTRIFRKNAKRYSVYALKTPKTYGYIQALQTEVVKCRLEADKGMPRTRTLRPDDPRKLGRLPPVPPPSVEELVQTQVKRGLGPEFNTNPPSV
ncbi:uncharacterized protein LOC121635100 [Melanotaenia boesemani]|uniref:uncharacterized protein LOC121635100 n=1 Tax=Melanotaenia boesemani TaxID=1250792 RepID=UPI001C05AB2C|nr:uncharacterized protein LOC121635100 [Melanotaenia boesemani]